MRCLECGNKAKKDCLYYRCRSCCRRNGFQCGTHIKSTWVPISTRQLLVARNTAAAMVDPPPPPPSHQYQQQEEQQLRLSSPSSSGVGEHFPTEVRGEATFTLVQVTTSEENESIDQYAYETTINIRGRVFRGILHDQGPHTPMVNYSYMNVHEGDEHNDVPSSLQSVNDLGSSALARLSKPNYPL